MTSITAGAVPLAKKSSNVASTGPINPINLHPTDDGTSETNVTFWSRVFPIPYRGSGGRKRHLLKEGLCLNPQP